jgi:hypothetical protein
LYWSSRKIHFASSKVGWTVGTEVAQGGLWGVIAHTTDGGRTWVDQKSPTRSLMNDLFFIDAEIGWIVGTAGTILKTTNSGNTTNIEIPENDTRKTCQLNQNYPNPFNSTTTIRYSLSASQEVYLRVYDMLGREVRTLMTGVQEAGDREVRFDARGLSSGIYFYHLQAGNQVEIRKLLLLR